MNSATMPACFTFIRTNFKVLFFTLAAALFVSACSQGNSTVTTGQEGGGIAIPAALDTLPTGGTLAAYIRVDNNNRQQMVINNGAASISLNGITEGSHTFTIDFEYVYTNPDTSIASDPIILASVSKTIVIGPGSNTLNILESEYDIDSFDEDGDGIPNLSEISNGTSPFAGINVTLISNNTGEDGATATFDVGLTSLPSDDVTFAINSSDSSEGITNQNAVTFTPDNWFDPQTITVTGIDDDIADGDISYSIELSAAMSADADYDGYDPADVSVINTDNDSSGVTVSTISGNTTETGSTATLTLVLNSVPTADVSINVSSSDPSEGNVDQTLLTFGTGNWNVPQTVTVYGVDDDLIDGNQQYSVQFSDTISSDTQYNGLTLAEVIVTNVDDDSPGFNVSPIDGDTSEDGTSASFSITLTSAPTAAVGISISSSDTTEGTVDVRSVSFDANNWNIPQIITVTGIDDTVDDGDQTYSVVLGAANSGDSNYSGVNPDDVSVNNTDDDTAGFTVSAISDNTTEAGATATFSVVLTSTPSADVNVGVSSSNTAEGTVDQSTLTFTAGNWGTPQTITVTGIDDDIADGNVAYSIQLGQATSADTQFDGIDPDDVTVTNVDNDSPGFNVSPISGNTSESGVTASFSVSLTSAPTADVTIAVSSSDTTEGTIDIVSLVFSPDNWDISQLVTVTGVDDQNDDGNQAYSIGLASATSADTTYSGLNPSDVNVINTDDDTAGFVVSAISGDTSEAGMTASFTVRLTSEPTADVTVGITSSDTNEGAIIGNASLTFTAGNWGTEQSVTVAGVDDYTDDGDQAYTIALAAATSTDNSYSGMDPSDVDVINVDDDTAGFVVSAISGDTTEEGATATFIIALASAPTDQVSIGVISSNTTEGIVDTDSVVFTPDTWNEAQTITVAGVDDDADDGDQAYTIILSAATSTDVNYSGLNPDDVSVTNIDNDTAGFAVSAISGNTSEAGASANFTVALTSAPTSIVTINIDSSDASEGTVSQNTLSFDISNWNIPQTVTVIGVNDDIDDGDQNYAIITGTATSTDSGFSGLNPANVNVVNTDDDVSGFTVSSISNNTAETGTTASFTVELTSEPTATVTVGVSSSDISEGIVDSSVLTFTPQNWNSAQTVTVTGVDDDVADGNQPFTVQLAPAVSSDGVYDGIDPTDVPVTNNDNDTSGIDVSAISGNTTEAGGSATFTVVLSSAPIADVTIGITSSNTNEGSVAGISSIIFTPDNWNTVQTVTVTGVNDDVDDGDQTYTIVLAEAVSTDSGYSGINPDDVSVTNIDDDIAGFIVGDISGNTTEAGGSATFTVTLTSEPTAAVGVDVSSSDTTEGTVNPNTLSFTSNNWNDPHTVTVTGVDDTILDGDQQYSIVLAQATSIDPNYAGFNPADVVVINIDNDNATPPTVSNGAITLTDVNGTGMSLSWNRASDTYYQQSELQYQVYYATSNVLTSVTNTESNGTLAMDWANDVTSFTTSNLSGLTDYYWNIIVRNPAGLKALYSTATEKTFAAGIPDQSFGSGGRIEFGNEDGMDQYLRKMIKTSDGNFLLVGSTTVTDSDIVLKKVSPSGQLIFDTVHDDGGNESASDVTVDANNNIYVSGAKDQLMTVWRFDSQGNIDTGFGVNGRINHAGGVGQGNDDGSVVMIDSQGNIVVIGSSWNNGDYDFFVWRFTSTGALDTQNFAAPNGYFSIDGPAGGNGWDRALSGIIDNNGRIIVGGFFDSGLLDNQSTDVDGVVLVLDSSGALDSQFGGGAGYVILNEGVISADRVSDIAIDSSGYILGVGITGPALSTDMIIWSLDPITGALNPNFNQGQGWLSHDGAGGFIGLSDSASGITIDPRSNNIVVVGTSFSYVEVSPYLNQMTLWRLTPDGTLDTSFDNDGFASFFSATHADGDGVGRAVLIGNDESIYSAGYTYGGANTDADFAIWNYR